MLSFWLYSDLMHRDNWLFKVDIPKMWYGISILESKINISILDNNYFHFSNKFLFRIFAVFKLYKIPMKLNYAREIEKIENINYNS